MIVAAYARTMAGAKRIATPKRDKLIALSRRWQAERDDSLSQVRIVPSPRAEQIVEQVAWWHGLTTADLYGPSRLTSVIEARFDAIAAVAINCRRRDERLSVSAIGRIFGRDHSTIISALRQRGLKQPYGRLQFVPAAKRAAPSSSA